ncbi:MAG: GNAT family N-acetyltransferase [Acidimicrobiales bacterium]|nr:GNAT family N-acetyltransferase [Acidimicrobiales bacterium]
MNIDDVTFHRRSFDELSPHELYALLRLRAEVFVVEQASAYLDPDGRDVEPDAEHLWFTDAEGAVVAALRILVDPGATRRIGRVVTRAESRGRGLAARLMAEALRGWTGHAVLNAQAHLEGWYATFGFERDGPDYDEDGIPHVPMRRHHLGTVPS